MKHVRKKFVIALWTIELVGILGVVGLLYGIFHGTFGKMPELEEMENPVNKYATQVFTDDGELLGTWSYSSANRIFVGYNDLPECLVQALVATEDERFFENSGVDLKALFRAVVKRGVMRQKSAGGGSTLTQQLAKQLYSQVASNSRERAQQKLVEWGIALRLERLYTKEEILTMYLNYFDFLYNAVGIKTASNTYFGKDPIDLTICEAATLVGMCKNPSLYNPKRHPERALQRRNTVIDQMVRNGFLTEAQAKEEKAKPLELQFRQSTHVDGIGTYTREYLRQYITARKPERSHYANLPYQRWYDDSLAWATDPLYGWCNKNTKNDGSNYDIYVDGLKIYTTLDSRMQRYAEQAVQEHIVQTLQPLFDKENASNRNAPYSKSLTATEVQNRLKAAKRQSERWNTMKSAGYSDSEIEASFNTPIEMTIYTPNGDVDTLMSPMDSLKYYKGLLRCGFMCMDNKTGYVKAYVGGINYSHMQYDMVSQARRQVGSTIKPYLYTVAMENGWSPCDEAPNIQVTYHIPGTTQTWTPRNGSRSRYGELVTLKWGLSQSNNWISAYLIDQLGPNNLVNYLHQFGIQNQGIHPSMSLCLGPCDISVAEMVGAYNTFPNAGVRRKPILVSRIEDSEGNVLFQNVSESHETISPTSAYKMIDMMKSVIDNGTGVRMRYRYKFTAQMAGKTGTTNNNSDAWFVGYTPSLTYGAWVGGDERDVHFASMANGQGAAAALPVAAIFLQKVFADKELPYKQSERFDIPASFDPCRNDYEFVGGGGEVMEDMGEDFNLPSEEPEVPAEELQEEVF